MSITTKKCNFCHSELRVSDEAQVVECPVCGCINGYGYSRSNQNEKYSKGAPGNKITGVMPNIQNHQQQPFSAAPNQGQAQLHVLLGGTKQPGSLHFVDTNCLFQQTPQASVPGYSPPLAKTTSFLQPPPQVSQSSQVSFRTLKTNYTSFQQLSQKSLSLQISPLIPEKANTTFQLPQRTSSPQWPSRSAYSTNSHEQPLQTSHPSVQEKTENLSQLAPKTSPQQVQEKINSISEQPHQSSPKGPPNSSYGNTSNQQPIQLSPQESPHQPQTSSPQGSSPRPSRFSSFLRPRAAQIPTQASSPLAHNDEYSQKPSQPSSQISSPPSKEDNNGQNQISTPPSSEADNGFSKKPLLATTKLSASQAPPLLQAPRIPVNNNGQNYQKTVPDTRPVSSSIASKPPVTTNSQSADSQNSRNTQAFRGISRATTNLKHERESYHDLKDIKRRSLENFDVYTSLLS
ncbi:hypothetical protein ACET3Z_030720 [Daucus carota]